MQTLEEQKTIILMSHDFPLTGTKHIKCNLLDDHSTCRYEMKSRRYTESETTVSRKLLR